MGGDELDQESAKQTTIFTFIDGNSKLEINKAVKIINETFNLSKGPSIKDLGTVESKFSILENYPIYQRVIQYLFE